MPRKTHLPRRRRRPADRASMRPRPDATENPDVRLGFLRSVEASMRPRPDATENLQSDVRALKSALLQ